MKGGTDIVDQKLLSIRVKPSLEKDHNCIFVFA